MTYRAKCTARRQRTMRRPMTAESLAEALRPIFGGRRFAATYEGRVAPWWAVLALERRWISDEAFDDVLEVSPVQPSPLWALVESDAYEPVVCPGCYAVDGPCAPGCIDAEMERAREEEREDFEDDFDDEEGAA